MFLGYDRPDMGDLSRYIVRQQAAQWELLGIVLGLRQYHIANSSKDHKHDLEACCRNMLINWLELDPSATWGKLDDAIKMMLLSTASAVSPNKEGNHGDVSKALYSLKI